MREMPIKIFAMPQFLSTLTYLMGKWSNWLTFAPYVLEGHIVPNLTVASLIGIRILCKVGRIVVFTDVACYVMYNGEVISTGHKEPSTDLWISPITPDAIKNQENLWGSPGATPSWAVTLATQFPVSVPKTPPAMEVATFMHSVQTRANAINFSHQAQCNPKISSLLKAKAMWKGFLKGNPNLSKELVMKYLNPSPTTAKGHMKWPKKASGAPNSRWKQRLT